MMCGRRTSKGWFRAADGTRCDPLTVIDACSRFVLCCRIVVPSRRDVQRWLEWAFREYGLPRALRTDNGPPFATTGAGRLSTLAVWWWKLGIQVERIDPGHPEQNGRHERFHLTLQQEAATPPAPTARQQQRRFDRLREDFNTERPHEALGQRPPACVYVASPRPYPCFQHGPCRELCARSRLSDRLLRGGLVLRLKSALDVPLQLRNHRGFILPARSRPAYPPTPRAAAGPVRVEYFGEVPFEVACLGAMSLSCHTTEIDPLEDSQ